MNAEIKRTMVVATWLVMSAWTLPADTPGFSLDGYLSRIGGLGSMSAEVFMEQARPAGFRWSDQGQSVARASKAPVTLFSFPVSEALVRFDKDVMSAVSAMLYSRGDDGPIERAAFQELLGKVRGALTEWAGQEPVPLDDPFRATGVRRTAEGWVNHGVKVQLLAAVSTAGGAAGVRRPEFLRMLIEPTDEQAQTAPLVPSSARPSRHEVSLTDLKDAVVIRPNGDRVIEGIPMIDQGDKGYCAVATTARILQFYGIDADQHELAQIAATSALQGTNPDVMIASVRRIGGRLGCRIRILEDFDSREYLRMIDQYNRLARRAKKPVIEEAVTYSVDLAYRAMDRELLAEARMRRQGPFLKFQKNVHDLVDSGLPLAWSVILGVVPETPAIQGGGGHMRIIHGYNPKTNELLYSDSWGRRHEEKRMSLQDAWTVTLGLYAIEPRYTTR